MDEENPTYQIYKFERQKKTGSRQENKGRTRVLI